MTAYASDEGSLINRQAGRARSIYRGVAYMSIVDAGETTMLHQRWI